jgi:DNA modification methylase
MSEIEVRQMPFTPMYDHDGITIYNEDCRKVLPWLGQFDLLLTDPPYGVERLLPKTTFGRDENASRSRKAKATDWGYLDWDKEPPPMWLLESAMECASTQILWGGNYYGLPASACWLVWDKDNGSNDFADCELAWTNMSRAVRKFKWRWNGMLQEHGGDKKEHRVHPTQKPLALMRWCLGLVPDAETVLDPFMGSGTTLLAARLEGRKAVGIEVNKSYCESAIERLRQGVLFGLLAVAQFSEIFSGWGCV